ncbi:Sterile alpha motif domain-containing protein 15 [Trichoplax sp. H2]|uniref:SAM domain-containing protein n=1 Tax=Trichoplax adhaerens TaxID=10228 RepID=B3S4L9_TRIAD|nr:hypothetical protein TRIADDRAFT_59134 [Trichoplax adhaerens]EDV22654.1 hypothetical protein TRIADDRAFT_59134 [Trichoplax adhaerens]RDD40034.1 Sterile alpha motif domain-containing protein 15 [Trichoplax sp. H2]|eukprot:XP_002115198.1 hypothetical protein TRIADDRAFT_59134 [Trichoplax adhaerens]
MAGIENEYGIPSCINWQAEAVADFIENIGFKQYRKTFLQNEIKGRNLIAVDASTLPKMGITDFDHIKIITKNIRELLKIEKPNSKRSIALPPRGTIATFLERKSRTGKTYDNLKFIPEDYIEEDW